MRKRWRTGTLLLTGPLIDRDPATAMPVDSQVLPAAPCRAEVHAEPRPRFHALTLLLVWAAVYLFSLASPTVLDDADATHAQAAQAMLRTGDWVTLHVDGIRYLEKAPLPYWLTAVSLWIFGNNSFAVHLPLALTVLGLVALGWHWGKRAFGEQAGFYTGLFLSTALGMFLFTRVFIPDALLSLLLAATIYAFLRALEDPGPRAHQWAYAAWFALAAAVLTKGFVALVFVFGAFALYLPLSGQLSRWRRLYPATGSLLLVAVAAPWHILAGLQNPNSSGEHGFFWVYIVNEHVLRVLGKRQPVDYNKLPAALYWSLHLVWLFPWSLFLPAAALFGWRARALWLPRLRRESGTFASRSALLLVLFSALVLLFFSLSTNQEYYTLPAYLPLLLLTAAALARMEREPGVGASGNSFRRTLLFGHVLFALIGVLATGALAFALWTSRKLPAASNIGDLFVQRGVGNYTLSMSHLFDLTGASFSALRLPAGMALITLAVGPLLALSFRLRDRQSAATMTVALTSAAFLVAAHLGLNRFAPMLSSQGFAATIADLESTHRIAPDAEVMLYGDQALGSSIPFYLQRQVELVEGRSTSMLFGSTFSDAPPIFLTREQLLHDWGHGPRKLLFVPLEHRSEVDPLLEQRSLKLLESAGKELLTDWPLESQTAPREAH